VATFVLVRHGAHDLIGKRLVGRSAEVHLNRAGMEQADRLATRLAGGGAHAVYTSPLPRARETAQPIAARLGHEARSAGEINEFDFGEWTGASFGDLDGLPQWRMFNVHRSGTRAPGGESMLDVQARIVGFMNVLRAGRPDGRFVLVSHGDVIRAALLYFLGVNLDLFHRIEVDLGSLSTVSIEPYGPRVERLNEVPDGQA
jgi:broad specificity phosphatase PhoE